MTTKMALIAFGGLALSTPASAQNDAGASSHPLSAINACRNIADDVERLRCFDRETAALNEAAIKRDILVIDRANVRAARRSLFGLRLPSFRLFGDRDELPEESEFTSIETTIKRAERGGTGWLFTLEDDARWVQTDSVQLAREPRAGTTIRIREGALGSFRANVGDAPAIRVRRVN